MKRLAAALLLSFVAALSVPGAQAADRPVTPKATIKPCSPRGCAPQRPAGTIPPLLTLPPTDSIR